MKSADQWSVELCGKWLTKEQIAAIQADALQHAAITAWGQKVPMSKPGSWSWNMACQQAHLAIVGEVPRV